jgi:hypothetical protein
MTLQCRASQPSPVHMPFWTTSLHPKPSYDINLSLQSSARFALLLNSCNMDCARP